MTYTLVRKEGQRSYMPVNMVNDLGVSIVADDVEIGLSRGCERESAKHHQSPERTGTDCESSRGEALAPSASS